jgi:hypothetical protein
MLNRSRWVTEQGQSQAQAVRQPSTPSNLCIHMGHLGVQIPGRELCTLFTGSQVRPLRLLPDSALSDRQ